MFSNNIYNPNDYASSSDGGLSLDEAKLLFLPKNDIRLSYLNSTPGTASAGQALIVDSSRNISNIGTINGVSLDNVGLLDSVSPGTVSSSKAVIVSVDKDITGFRNLTATTYNSYNAAVYNAFSASQGAIGSTMDVQLQMNSTTGACIGTTTNHTFALIANNNKFLTCSGVGNVGIGVTPSATYKLTTGTFNCSTLYVGGGLVSGLSYIANSSPGTSQASKAIVLDASKDITGLNNVTAVKYSTYSSTAYTPLALSSGTIGSTSDVALQLNSLGWNDWGTTSAHGFRLMTSNSARLSINTAGQIGLPTPNASYALNVTGDINCSNLYLNGTAISVPGASADLTCTAFRLNQTNTAPSTSCLYSLDNNSTNYALTYKFSDLPAAYCATNSGITGCITMKSQLNHFQCCQDWQRLAINTNLPSQAWVCNPQAGVYTGRLSLNWINSGTSTTTPGDWQHQILDPYASAGSTYSIVFPQVNATPALRCFSTRAVGINKFTVDPYSNLDVSGTIRTTDGLWIGDTSIVLASLSERKIVALTSTMTNGARSSFIIGKSLNSYDSAVLSYNYVGASSQQNRVSIGQYGNDDVLNITPGRVGINNTAPRCPLEVSGSTTISLGIGGTSYSYWKFLLYGSSYNNTYSSGIGPVSFQMTLWVNGSAHITDQIYSTSDRRLKKSIKQLEVNDDDYLKFEPICYSWREDSSEKTNFGLIAQDVAKIDASLVSVSEKAGLEGDDESPANLQMSVNYLSLTVINMKVIQKLMKRIEELEKKMT